MSVDKNSADWAANGYFSVIGAKLGGEWLRVLLGIGGMMVHIFIFF